MLNNYCGACGQPVEQHGERLKPEWIEILRKLEEAGNTIRIVNGQICGVPLKKRRD